MSANKKQLPKQKKKKRSRKLLDLPKTCYRVQYLPEHPRADLFGMVPEHVLVMEALIGGPIPEGMVIHHRDWFKLNNPTNGSNFQLMSRLHHQQLPERQAQFIIEKGLLEEFFQWWDVHKDDVDRVRQLEYKIAHHENKLVRNRFRGKLNKRIINGVQSIVTSDPGGTSSGS